MVLKQCQSRLKLFNFNHPEKWYDPQDRASIFVPAATSIFVRASACSQCNLTPSFSKFEKTPLRWRRAPGVNITHLSAATWMSVRGNKQRLRLQYQTVFNCMSATSNVATTHKNGSFFSCDDLVYIKCTSELELRFFQRPQSYVLQN